ncbi:MAG: cell division protein ZapB [Deltaproteobacteria bacterium]|jgi:septation ring formation regulator EzrA|nr:cell division protein ZapB [Deltaproteobacteria bacterium]
MDFSKLDLLESRLLSLLERLAELEKENQSLKESLASSREEQESSRRELTGLAAARSQAADRLDSLLERLAQAGFSG